MNVSILWRLKAQRYRMTGTECGLCGAKTFPPRPVCQDCNSTGGFLVYPRETLVFSLPPGALPGSPARQPAIALLPEA